MSLPKAVLRQLRDADFPGQAEEDLSFYEESHLLQAEQHLNVGGRQWKMMDRGEVGLQGIVGEMQVELQGKGGKTQLDLPWHRALTQESGEVEMHKSDALAERTLT